MDPIGAASGVLGVAEVGFSLAATLYKYASSVKSAEKELKAIAKDVELTSKVLKQTHEQIQRDENARLCTSEALDLTSDVLSGCQDAFREVDEALKGSIKTDASGKPSVTIGARMRWPLKSGKLDVLRANLEKLKTTLLLMLSVLAYGRKVLDSRTSSNDTKADLSLDKLQIQNLVEARDEATRRYEEMSASSAKFEARLNANMQPPLPPVPPPTYSASTHGAVSQIMVPPQVSNFRAAGAGQSRDSQTSGVSNTSVNARVSDCLGLCASAVLQLANTIDEATHRWHTAQTLDHHIVTESLKAAIEAVTNLNDEGQAYSSPAFIVPSNKRTVPEQYTQSMAHLDVEQTTASGRKSNDESVSTSTPGSEQDSQTTWRKAGTRYPSSSMLYIPPPPPPFTTPYWVAQLPPPPPRMSGIVPPPHGQFIPPPPGHTLSYDDRRPFEHNYPPSVEQRACTPTTNAEFISGPEFFGPGRAMPALSSDHDEPLEPYGTMNQPSVQGSTRKSRKADSLAVNHRPWLDSFSRRRSGSTGSKKEQMFKIQDQHENTEDEDADEEEAAAIQEESDDSDDGLFSVPLRGSGQQDNSSENRPSLAVKDNILGMTDDSKTVSYKKAELKLKGFETLGSDSSEGSGLSRGSHLFSNGTWAERPPPEVIVASLDEFFPHLDLDEPVGEECAEHTDSSTLSTGKSTLSIDGLGTIEWTRDQLIGSSALGKVYLGVNIVTLGLLTVKQVEINTSNTDRAKLRESMNTLATEIGTLKDLSHTNILQYLGCQLEEHNIYIIQEYVSGGSVGSCLRKHAKFEEPVVSSITRQMLSGLSYLHTQGIFHGHLKADNVYLDLDGKCKISDFGVFTYSVDLYTNNTGSVLDSIFWMAPEIIQAQRPPSTALDLSNVTDKGYSAKSDIWSLGCVVLEMLAGRRPWNKEEAIGAIYKLGSLSQAPPIPEDVASTATPAALAFIYDCFTIDPSERPSAETLLGGAPLCIVDRNFDFCETALFASTKDAIYVKRNKVVDDDKDNLQPKGALSLAPIDTLDPTDYKSTELQSLVEKKRSYLEQRKTHCHYDFDANSDHTTEQEPTYDVVDDLLQKWTTVVV